MIEKIIDLAKLVLAILPFVLLCIWNAKANLPKTERSKQYPMPLLALIYVIAAMLLLNTVNEWLLGLLNKIPKWIMALSELSFMPEKIGEYIEKFSRLVEEFIRGLNLNFWMFFITNTAIMLVYIYVKKLAAAIMNKTVKTDGRLHQKISGIFYEFLPDKSKWCIKESYVQARSLFKVFYYGAVTLSAILMLVSRTLYYKGLIESVFYPVFGIIAMGEMYFFLDGATRREYSNDILGEDEDAYKTVNYSLLRKFLRSIFGDKLLTENTSINNALAYDVTTDDIIRDLEKSEDPKVVTFASYVSAMNKTGETIDHNYLRSSLDLLSGKSILFNNPFYSDLIPYAFYPMNRALLSHQKVLVVLGRHSIEDDIKGWLEKGIEAVTNIPFMWRVGVLSDCEQELDIGIITRSDVLNMELHNANADFLEQVGFFVIIEPSKLISTAQIGLNLLVKKCKTDEDKKIVYCLCDKNCDGLVDAMSHILMTSITEVSATRKHLGTSSYMCWESDDDYLHHRLVPNISRYLGMGTELSFAALKNQVSKTKWYGGEAFPVTDIRWIDKQYYYDLTKYANLPTSPEVMDECFVTSANFWSAETEKNCYLTVEDESNNMFEILRDFSTRTTEQGFVNIISSDYLLKDYMGDNASIFESDAKAIPYIVADYTRSNRNTVLRLALMMSIFPVSEETLSRELSLLGVKVFNLKKQIWYELYNCYSRISVLSELPDDYTAAVNEAYFKTISVADTEITSEIIRKGETFNIKTGKLETTYTIASSDFLSLCVSDLRSAGYVAEDEMGERYYLGAELSGHIYQKYLPGQFFTFGGKYYEMQYLTADGQVLVRRAADHIKGRPAYRQIREYTISGTRASAKIGAQQNISGMKVVREFADISVKTPGYYKLERYNDLANASKISFEGERNGIPERIYRNKEILRIELPDNGKLTDSIRYTVATLFNEVFRTIFAENQAFICAVTDDSFMGEESEIRPLTYSVKGEGYELKPNAIYIIEDSQLDLGLTVAVERNLERIFGIVQDYLDWHLGALEESLDPPSEHRPPVIFGGSDEPRKGGLSRIKDGIRKIADKIKSRFKKKPKGGEAPMPEDSTPGSPMPKEPTPDRDDLVDDVPNSEEKTDKKKEKKSEKGKAGKKGVPKEEKPEKEKKGLFGWLRGKKKKKDDKAPFDMDPEGGPSNDNTSDDDGLPGEPPENDAEKHPDGELEVMKNLSEIAEAPMTNETVRSSDEDRAAKIASFGERRPYHERYYLLYGRESDPGCIDPSGTCSYLSETIVKNNTLKQAREGRRIAELIESTYNPGKPDARYCDFCGTEIYGVEYETLADGRDRCLHCGRTAIKTGDEFRKIFEDVKRNLESFFGIRINAGIKVEMVNSKTLHKRLGHAFIPTPKSDGRVLGVAISDKHGYTLLVENGSPRMASMLTMAHELTHIWQYINWKDKAIRKKYGKKMRLEIYEGMAKWVEIQYAYLINEPATAKREEIITSYRDDEYGHGFLRYRANYPFSQGTVITKPTPFMFPDEPLEMQYCGAITVNLPTNGINPGDLNGGSGKKPAGDTPVMPTSAVIGPIERRPDDLFRYGYSLLSEDERVLYDKLLDAANNFAPSIESIGASLTDTQVQKISEYLRRDHPEMFWLRHGVTFYFDTSTHIVSRITLEYAMTREEAERRMEQIGDAVEPFLSRITDDMSDYEVALRLYENIISLVDYDTIGLERQKKTEIPPADQPDDLRSIYGVFVLKKAVCAGYAKALQYLLNLIGIECLYVTSATHAWNIIKLEGDYYHLDVTWGDSSSTKKDRSSNEINYDCFCINDEALSMLDAHTPEDIFPIPACTSLKCNYHKRHGLYFESYDFDKIRDIVCESVGLERFDISFRFGSQTAYDKAKSDLITSARFKEAIQYSNLKNEARLDLSYRYQTKDNKFIIGFYLCRL